ncbi:hypothetical protein BKA65DRAFT_559796 [Rhexocercosporidium sp. MPI-PUGE-AT-0058]|nr:hypothetical protein BKA65DRAFT_559796 [Rhexocercosporidium sp. MPI-PUGE-AT-0058]
MSRNICISADDGQTGFLIVEPPLTDKTFSSKLDSKFGASIIPHKQGKVSDKAATLRESGADTLCIIPPTHKAKFDITMELVATDKKARVQMLSTLPENLLNHSTQLKKGILPLPIEPNHKFAPIASSDVAFVIEYILQGKCKHGFDDRQTISPLCFPRYHWLGSTGSGGFL